MKRFWKGSKGAVTVMVTLLLVPALLISGTGVDLARIYTARSVVQDANQLAANAALTQYDAMLQDLYGLFAVAAEDAELSQMVTDYVNLSIYGTKKPQDAGTTAGTFQLFSGSVSSCQVSPQQSLGEITALRHQIEEYAKFRAPVVIAEEIIERIKSFEKIKANSDVIKDKAAIDGMVSDIQKLLIEVKDAIDAADDFRDTQSALIAELNKLLTEVNRQFKLLVSYRQKYEQTKGSGRFYEKEELEDIDKAFATITRNITRLASANGKVYIKSWVAGEEDDEGEWQDGKEVDEKTLSRSLMSLTDYVKSNSFRNEYLKLLDQMVRKCEQLDSKTNSIRTECKNLEAKLNSGQCDKDLADAIREQLTAYKALADMKAKPLAEEVRTYNSDIMENFISNFSGVVYGNLDDNNTPTGDYLSVSSLTGLDSIRDFDINIVETNKTLQGSQKADEGRLSRMANLTGYKYSDRYRYTAFSNGSVFRNGQQDFYQTLKQVAHEENKKKSESTIDKILDYLDSMKERLEGLYDYDPQGAHYYKAQTSEEAEKPFGGDALSSKDSAISELGSSLDKVSGLMDGLDKASRKVLLVAYASEMFSCCTDPDTKKDPDEPKRITLSGVPMDTNVNYFYQSELEYLYHGNLNNAAANMIAVSGTILLIRFVFNYIATFTVESVKTTIQSIKTALGAIPVIGAAVGFAVGELARIAFALGESILDVTDMRNGDAVSIIKTQDTWKLSLINFAEELTKEQLQMKDGKKVEDKNGLYYIDYLRIFLLLKSGDTLAVRMEDLIELNVTNAKNSVYQKGSTIAGNEGAITSKPYFELDKQAISVTVTTTVELRFLFFSMGYFQKGINGVRPPETQTLTVVDQRGY